MAFEPLFPIANIFSWIGIDFIQETDYKKPNPTKTSANTLLKQVTTQLTNREPNQLNQLTKPITHGQPELINQATNQTNKLNQPTKPTNKSNQPKLINQQRN